MRTRNNERARLCVKISSPLTPNANASCIELIPKHQSNSPYGKIGVISGPLPSKVPGAVGRNRNIRFSSSHSPEYGKSAGNGVP